MDSPKFQANKVQRTHCEKDNDYREDNNDIFQKCNDFDNYDNYTNYENVIFIDNLKYILKSFEVLEGNKSYTYEYNDPYDISQGLVKKDTPKTQIKYVFDNDKVYLEIVKREPKCKMEYMYIDNKDKSKGMICKNITIPQCVYINFNDPKNLLNLDLLEYKKLTGEIADLTDDLELFS